MKAGCNYKIHWCENMAYVMRGRPERLEDLFISEDYDPSQIKCDVTYSLPESKRLDKVYDKAIQLKKEKRDKRWKISYLNVRSMKSADGHREDVAMDEVVMDADIFGLGETWLEEDMEVNFEGFDDCFSNFGTGKGVAGYIKLKLIAQPKLYQQKHILPFSRRQENSTLYFCTSVATLKQMNYLITLMFGLKKMCLQLSLVILIKILHNTKNLLLQGK